MKHMLATCFFSATSTCCLDDWRLVDAVLDVGAELNVVEWRAALVEMAAGAVENAVAGRWPSGKEGLRAATLERG